MNLLEYISQDIKLLEKRETPKGTEQDVEVLWQRAGVINNNRRRYRKELLGREIKKIQAEIDSGKTVWGCGFHPADGVGLPQNISHYWKRIWMEADGSCKGILTLVPTKVGSDIQALIRHGRLGISSRGFGSTTQRTAFVDGGKRETFNDVNDDFKMVTPGDWVVGPSVSGAGNITEEIQGLESKLNEDKKYSGVAMSFDTGRTPEEVMKIIYQTYVNLGKFKGTFDQFKKAWSKSEGKEEGNMKDTELEKFTEMVYRQSDQNISLAEFKRRYGVLVEAVIETEAGKYKDMESALRALCSTEEEATRLLKELEPKQKVLPKDVRWEALAAGCDPQIFADKLNERIARDDADDGVPLTIQVTENVLAEASRAGVDITDPEARKKYLEIYYKQRQETEAQEARKLEEEISLSDKELAEIEKKKKE